ncbi:hypothetical protein DFH11DRAFT_1004863 [Phellopilus nigrolimitatus]|nr:hypothetical protein DFH11DRAFT_1004863 [Phellopilus nigrolimitatus]
MFPLFLLYRAATFALFIVCNAVICSVAAWNLSFVQDLARVARIDAFLIFLGAFGLLVVFPIIFIDVIRKGAVSSRVWFEACWLTLFWMLNFAGAAAVTAVAPDAVCSFSSAKSLSSGSACTSARVLVVFSWLNTGFLFLYFFLLASFAIAHQKENNGVWRAGVREFPWFETKQSLRSAPTSPIMSRFGRAKSPSLAVPTPRRPPPHFVHGRAGLDSRVEIEHFTDVASLEEQPLPPAPAALAPTAPNALAFYPQHVQSTMKNVPTYLRQHLLLLTYLVPLPNPSATGRGHSPSAQTAPSRSAPRRSSAHAAPPSRQGSGASSNSRKSGRSKAPPPLTLERSATRAAGVLPAMPSPSRSRPTGPRTRSGSSSFVRPRPPPLNLTLEGSTPHVQR